MIKLIHGDCLDKLKDLEENSIDAIVTDPPYGLLFMGNAWDHGVPSIEVWKECIRVLKPGGHLLAFSGTRTYHRMVVAIEDAGFEVRDMIEWVYGSGFPKSLNIGKAVDKLRGNERVPYERPDFIARSNKTPQRESQVICGEKGKYTKGTSEWGGWGTALKPAHEPICVARKPLAEKTVAENCLKYGTGGINIDESRVEYISEKDKKEGQSARPSKTSNSNEYALNHGGLEGMDRSDRSDITGRFPANLIHDNSEEVRECFPETKSGSVSGYNFEKGNQDNPSRNVTNIKSGVYFGDSGNASRFFKSIIYTSKASKGERNKGCEGLDDIINHGHYAQDEWSRNNMGNTPDAKRQPTKNNHPTVKPIALMEYLIKMVSREDSVILDPYMGSGSTGVACKRLQRNFVGIELEAEYLKIAESRINTVNDLFTNE